jgi:potassium-transporting ATPase KdpC subunit
MKQQIFIAIKLTVICILFFAGLYTLLIWGIAQATPEHGNGTTIQANGKTIGYALEGQQFNQDRYFWSRPSAAAYNASASSGSNKGPSNPAYLKDVADRLDSFLVHNPGIQKEAVPSELVTASGSGLDPDISVPAARVQIKRIAKMRNITEEQVSNLIHKHTTPAFLGIFGPSFVNVLQLNIALDAVGK